MAKYIDADKLKKALKELPEQERIEYMGIYDVINFQPTADVQEVKHGKWLCVNPNINVYMCDCCGSEFWLPGSSPKEKGFEHCPYCGVKMESEV